MAKNILKEAIADAKAVREVALANAKAALEEAFTPKLQSINPELHNEFSKYFSSETQALWEHGFLEMDPTEENPIVRLTEKALNEEEVLKLEKDRQYTLKEIIRIIISR